MNSITYKIRIDNLEFKQDNVILAIHCPLEVFYLSVKESQLKEIPEELRKHYIITDSDLYDSDGYHSSEQIYSNLDILFKSKDFKEFCYLSYEYTKNGIDCEYECKLLRILSVDDSVNLEADLDDEDVAFVRENSVPLDDDEAEELFTVVENFVQGGDIDG